MTGPGRREGKDKDKVWGSDLVTNGADLEMATQEKEQFWGSHRVQRGWCVSEGPGRGTQKGFRGPQERHPSESGGCQKLVEKKVRGPTDTIPGLQTFKPSSILQVRVVHLQLSDEGTEAKAS